MAWAGAGGDGWMRAEVSVVNPSEVASAEGVRRYPRGTFGVRCGGQSRPRQARGKRRGLREEGRRSERSFRRQELARRRVCIEGKKTGLPWGSRRK